MSGPRGQGDEAVLDLVRGCETLHPEIRSGEEAGCSEGEALAHAVLQSWRAQQRLISDPYPLIPPLPRRLTMPAPQAYLIACNVAPGLLRASRTWPFRKWHDADQAAIRSAVQEARDLQRIWKGRLLGNDSHPGAIQLAKRDAAAVGMEAAVEYRLGDCGGWQLGGLRPSLVVTNPPWGLRLGGEAGGRGRGQGGGGRGEDGDGAWGGREGAGGGGEGRWESVAEEPSSKGELEGSWRALSDFLRQQCGGEEKLDKGQGGGRIEEGEGG